MYKVLLEYFVPHWHLVCAFSPTSCETTKYFEVRSKKYIQDDDVAYFRATSNLHIEEAIRSLMMEALRSSETIAYYTIVGECFFYHEVLSENMRGMSFSVTRGPGHAVDHEVLFMSLDPNRA